MGWSCVPLAGLRFVSPSSLRDCVRGDGLACVRKDPLVGECAEGGPLFSVPSAVGLRNMASEITVLGWSP
eukprot:1587101-Amphidinium_carterae.1